MCHTSTHSLKPKLKYVELSDIEDEVNFDDENSPSPPPLSQPRATNTASIHEKAQLIINSLVVAPANAKALSTDKNMERARKETITSLRQYGKLLGASSTQNITHARMSRPKLTLNHQVVSHKASKSKASKKMEWAIRTVVLLPFGIDSEPGSDPLIHVNEWHYFLHSYDDPKSILNRLKTDCLWTTQIDIDRLKWTNNQVTVQFASWFPDAFAWYKENIHLHTTECLWCLVVAWQSKFQVQHFTNMDHPSGTKVVEYGLKPKIGCDSQQLFISFTAQIPEELVLHWKGVQTITLDMISPSDLEVSDADSPILNWDFLTNNKKREIVELSSDSSDTEEYHGKGKGKAPPPPQKKHRLNNGLSTHF
ncbi:hypothetical protein P691DRAFT_768091 [Macrolepiota fuliginosa MF-IS2]|uniref:Uncharacterized protein n=1 Tax=Macrolepiota fuliginosa MF-IS2 TaxID=1400762 RepID=A0A9P5WWF6_9AGAR|nr:hypothetical protein P691DRAFT_768091 [Macrolepiota fuliginosa MF-IS2]